MSKYFKENKIDIEMEGIVTKKILVELLREVFGLCMTMVQAAEAIVVCHQNVKQVSDKPPMPGMSLPPESYQNLFIIGKFANFL